MLRFRNRSSCAPPFPLRKPSQNGPRCQGFATPCRNGAPLTAPGRSEETIPHRRERRVGKLNDPASKHLATSPARSRTRYYASRHLHSGRGAGCRNFSRLPVRGRAFSLDILFYRTGRFRARILSGEPNLSTTSFLRLPVDGRKAGAPQNGQYLRNNNTLCRRLGLGHSPRMPRRDRFGSTFSDSPIRDELLVNCLMGCDGPDTQSVKIVV